MASRRLPIALCVAQTVATAVLTLWADRMELIVCLAGNRIPPQFVKLGLPVLPLREIWRGINAPTFPFNQARPKLFQLFGLSVPEILYDSRGCSLVSDRTIPQRTEGADESSCRGYNPDLGSDSALPFHHAHVGTIWDGDLR